MCERTRLAVSQRSGCGNTEGAPNWEAIRAAVIDSAQSRPTSTVSWKRAALCTAAPPSSAPTKTPRQRDEPDRTRLIQSRNHGFEHRVPSYVANCLAMSRAEG
jgi:hypothetical protein